MRVSEILIDWYENNKRDLPWRHSDSAYHIWLSEIILQQTRVNQGLDYYMKFILKYPDVVSMANASIDDILKLWQGLGYYTRARNLHKTAQIVANEYGGLFPAKYEELLKLKGIGNYTAAAISSFAFKIPVALIDGNVYRVITRLFGLDLPIDTARGREVVKMRADELLDQHKPDIYNQAIMEFGAMVCLPRKPLCEQCVLSHLCNAYERGMQEFLPVKAKKQRKKIRHLHYLFIRHGKLTYLNRRKERDIWNSLYEFPLIETKGQEDFRELINTSAWRNIFGNNIIKQIDGTRIYNHLLTHQHLVCYFHMVEMDEKTIIRNPDYLPLTMDQLPKYAVPRVIDKYLQDLFHEDLL